MSLHRPTGYVRAGGALASLLATLALVFAGLAPGALAQSAVPSAATADWPMFRGDAARRSESSEGPIGQPVLRWRYQAQGAVNATISIVGDLVYASSDDGILHALDLASGTERWSFAPTHSPVSGPTVADGVVYVFDGIGTLFALDAATGQERWHAATPLDGPSNPTVAAGGLYVGTAGGDLVAIDIPTGVERWRDAVSTGGGGVHTPALAGGIVYVGSDTGGFVAVDASTGKLVWHVDTGADQTATAVVADGIAYLGAGGDATTGALRALDASTGMPLWVDPEPIYSPAVSGGVAYSGSSSGLVTAHDEATGKELWRFVVQGTARGTGVAQGVVYVPADAEHRVYALDAATGKELWRFDVDGANDGGIAIAHGSVFVGTALGGVYAIGGDGSTGAPASPGPSTPSPTGTPAAAPSPSAAASPVAVTPPAEFVWSATGGGDGMNFPGSLALDAQGRLWVADTGNSRFAIFTPDGAFKKYWGSKGTGNGQFNLQRSNGDGYGAIAFAPDGSFYVLDVGNRRVQHFDKDRQFVGSWGGFGAGAGQYNDPIGIVVDAQGVVHVLDDVRDVVESYNKDGKVLGSFKAHPDTKSGFNTANSLALDAAGNVYISDCCDAGNQVKKLDSTGNVLATIGSAGTGPGRFSDQPGSMAVDSAGRLFVTQGPTGNGDKVQVFGPDGSFLSSFGSLGSGDGQLGFATSVLLDGQGDVYVADAGASRIEKFSLLPPFAPSAAVSPSPAALIPDGRYATAPVTPDQIRAAIVAAGHDPGQWTTTAKSTVFTLSFDGGRLKAYGADDGGVIYHLWDGAYHVVDTHTLVATDTFNSITTTYGYSLVGDVLTMKLVHDTNQDPGELSAQTAIFNTAPFTRVR